MLSASIQALHSRKETHPGHVTTQLHTLSSELILCPAPVVVMILPSGRSLVLGWSQSKSRHRAPALVHFPKGGYPVSMEVTDGAGRMLWGWWHPVETKETLWTSGWPLWSLSSFGIEEGGNIRGSRSG